MSEAPVYQEILYLDDFVHRNSNNVHWDHVKFNHAVYLEQIRIIPRCCSVGLKNGQKHLGQTSPSKFKLEFYANNLNRSDDRATLDKIGSLVYDDEVSKPSHSSYILEPSSVPIDWLVIVGSYSCLSLAIVGVKAKAATTSTTTTTETATSTTTTTTTTTTNMFPIDQPPPPLPPHLFMHPPPPINPAGFINTPPPQFPTTIPPPPLLPNPTNPSLIALNQNSSHQNGLLLRTGSSSNQQQQQQQPGRTYAGSNQRYHPYMMNQQQKYNGSYNNHFLNRQYPNPRMMSPHFMMMQANSGGTNENEMMDDEEARSIDEDEFEEMMENGEDELNGEMEDGDEDDFDEEEEREDENDEDSGESALVKWYLNLDENHIESSETERAITDIGAVKADNDVLDQYLTHQLSQFNTNRKSASIVNPCLNDYELYLAKKRLQQEAINSSEQADEKIDSFVSQFEKLFGEKPKTPPPTTETTTEPTTEPTTTVAAVEEKDINQSQVDYLDDLVSRLKTESYSYALFDRLPRDKLESIVTTHLIAPEHYTDKKRFNVGVKLANLLLVRFDRGDETRSREWMQKLAKRLLSLCTASECVVQSTKLKCLSCLYDLIGTRQGCEAFVDGNHYSKMLELFSPSKTLTSRMSAALSAILAKVTFCDSLSKFSTSCESKFNYSVVRLPTKREEEMAAKKSGSEEEVSSIEQDLNTITSYIKRTLEADMTTTSTESTGVIWRAARDKRGGKERRRRAAEGQPSMEEVYDEEEGRFNQMPVRTIFDDLMRLRTASSRHRPKLAALNALLRFMHEFDFFTHLLTFSASASSRLASIEWIINEVLLPSELNNYSLAGIEYLLSNSSLSRCLDEVFTAKIKSARLIVTAANVLSSLVSLGRTLDTIRSSSQDTNTQILRATSLIQSINFEVVSSLSLSTKWFRLIDLLLLPDGGFSNSYARVLLDWLEFVIYDRNFTSAQQKTDNSIQFARLYIINSLTHILHTACKTNTRWSSSQCVDGSTLMRLNKLVSTLINYMIITKLRPDLAHNRSYFELIDRLKAIKSHLEPFAFRSSNSKSNHDFASLNLCIDSFRDSIDRNLSLFFSKTHLNTTIKQRQKLTYLNGNITQMRVIKRLLEPLTMRSNRFMTQKLILGHLISRNVLHILLNYLTRISDYMMFYLYIKSIPCDISTVDALLDLIEPSLYILKVYLANLTEPNRMASTTLPILFKFYALISHSLIKKEEKSEKGDKTDKSLVKKTIKQWYANRVVARLQASVSTRSRLVTAYLNDIFMSFTNRSVLIDELAKFALDTPFYMNHGLVLMASLLKAMSHSHFGKYLNEPLKDKNSSLSRLLCHVYQISQASRASTTARQIFARLSRESSINESLCAIMMRLLYERFDDMRSRLGVKDQEIKIEKRRRSGAGLKRHHEEIEAISDDEEDEHEADENGEDVNDDSDDADDYDDEKRMGDNDEDYSIYDTKTIWNSSSGGDKATAANTSTSNNTDSSASILGEDMLLQKSLNNSLSSIAAEAKESAIKFAEMTRSVQEFAKVVRFVADLVAMSSRFRAEFGLHLKLNPNNEDETYIKADSYKYILIDMIKYFKQIDMSNSDMSSDSSSEEKPKRQLLTRAQEAITEFVDTSCRYNFLDFKCMQLVRFVVQSFVANVNSSLKPSWPNSPDLRARLLTTLVLIVDRIISNDVDVRRLDFLSLVASLSNEIKSAGASLSGRVADSVNMLLIVIVEILARAINSGRFERYKVFKESRLKWTTASKMTNEMLIDSIATQSLTESSAAASSLHPLIALDKILDESPIGSSRKWKLAQSQLKSLVKLLNEFEPEEGEMLPLATNNSEVELIYKLKKSRDGLVEETNVYNDEDDDMSIDDITTNPATNAEIITWCKSSKESILISDSSLYTKLVAAIEENERIHQQHVQQQRQLNLIQQQQKQQLIENGNQQPAAKAKAEVINTRTGIAFKAPMRGGHVNQANRAAAANTQQNNTNQSNIPRVDSFRTRTPNTSRPPSLHVDDYVRLEKQQQQQQQSTTTVNEASNKPTEIVNTNQKEQPQMIKSNSFSGNPPAVTTTIPATTSSLEISSLSTTMSTPSLQSSSNATSNLQVHSQSYPKLSSPNQVTSPSQPNLSLTTAPSSTSPPPQQPQQQQQTISNPNNNNNNNPNIDSTPNNVNVNPSINKNSSLNSPLPKSISNSNFNSCGIDIHDLQQSSLSQQQPQQKQQQRFNTNFNNSQVFQSPQQQQQQGNFPTQQLMSPNEGQFNYMLGPPPPSQPFQQPPPFHPHMSPNLVGGPSNQFQMPPPSVPLQQQSRFPLNPQFRPPFDVRRLSNNKNSGGNQNNSGNNNQNYRGQYQ